VFPEENVLGQKFVISATLYTSVREAGLRDDLTKSIHYGEVSHFIKKYMEENTFQLLETVVERLAEKMLLEIKGLLKVTLELKKPWAPVGLPLESVGVEIVRGWHQAYVALGSNVGEKESYLRRGVKDLDETSGCEVVKVSDFISTKPYGGVEQDDFLNGVLELRTLLTPLELLERIHEIELAHGRERKIHWGPRTLDLDILLYDNLILNTEKLLIPHVEMHKRDFVLTPLSQIAGYKRHPILMKTVDEMLEDIK
jgi:dihydroneopterin aldolase/2-amino-4-hydroxy-6-hydroxymethyldihydropteridine diphosphokinase